MISTILPRTARFTGLALLTIPVAACAAAHDHAGHDHAAHERETTPVAAPEEAPASPEGKGAGAIIARQLPTYPLDTCVVGGEKLGEMGEPLDLLYAGKLVRLCCDSCLEGFEEDPARYVAAIVAAVIEAQLDSYPLTICPVSGMELGSMGDAHDHVEGTRLVRFCCKACVPKFQEDPATYLERIDAVKGDS